MTLDDERIPWTAHEAVLRDFPLPKRRHARNDGDDRDRYLSDIAEQIHIARDHLAELEAKYRRMMAVEVDHDPDPGFTRRPGVDPRLFESVGTDVFEEWRTREERPVIDIATGGLV